MVLRRSYVAALVLGAFLWLSSSLGLLGMWDSRQAAAGMTPISRGNSSFPNVALMFNVDWGEDELPKILDVLAEKRAKATFFLTGSWAEKNAGLARRIVAEGHEIGNHGAVHSHIESMPEDQLRRLIESGEERIRLSSGAVPSKLFAPPYGEWNEGIVAAASRMGYLTILWTVDTVDWRLPPPEAIWKRALGGAVPGALILMHPTPPTVSALPLVIDGLRDKGYVLTTVSGCIRGGP